LLDFNCAEGKTANRHHSHLRKQIGSGEYHLDGKGGLDLSKYESVEDKMKPVFKKLFGEK